MWSVWNESIEAEKEIVTGNDVTINKKAPTAKIIEMIPVMDKTVEIEPNVEQNLHYYDKTWTTRFVANLNQLFAIKVLLVMSYSWRASSRKKLFCDDSILNKEKPWFVFIKKRTNVVLFKIIAANKNFYVWYCPLLRDCLQILLQ